MDLVGFDAFRRRPANANAAADAALPAAGPLAGAPPPAAGSPAPAPPPAGSGHSPPGGVKRESSRSPNTPQARRGPPHSHRVGGGANSSSRGTALRAIACRGEQGGERRPRRGEQGAGQRPRRGEQGGGRRPRSGARPLCGTTATVRGRRPRPRWRSTISGARSPAEILCH